MTTLCLEESTPAEIHPFQGFSVFVEFFKYLFTEFAAYSKPPSKDNHSLIQRRNNVTRVRVEPESSNQGRRKNDALTLSATLPTLAAAVIDTEC